MRISLQQKSLRKLLYRLPKVGIKSKSNNHVGYFVCREHEWFKKDLPAYLFPTPTDHDASIIDVDVVREVCDVSYLYICPPPAPAPSPTEWFKKELPAYLFPTPIDHDASIIDVDVVREVCDVSCKLSIYLPPAPPPHPRPLPNWVV